MRNKFNSGATKNYFTGTSNRKRNALHLFNVSSMLLEKNLSCLNIKKTAGMDQIPVKCFKEAPNALVYPLSRMKNLSVKLSVFPGELIVVKLKALFKKVSKTDPKN